MKLSFLLIMRTSRLTTSLITLSREIRTTGSPRFCTTKGSNTNKEEEEEGEKGTSVSVAKAWATSILGGSEKGSTKKEQGLKRSDLGQGKASKQPVYRRRLSDMSWTTEPMDDKLIWVDCEMTGLDYNQEMIMEIGVVITNKDLNEIARQPSIIVQVPEEKLRNMSAWCVKHHGDSGLTEACRQSKLTSEQVDEQLFNFVQKHTKNQECPMAGNSIYMDRIFISKQFPKFHSHFHYRNVDVSTVKEIVRRWYPEEYFQAPKKKWSHRVLDDILDSIEELRYYRMAVFKDMGKDNVKQSNVSPNQSKDAG